MKKKLILYVFLGLVFVVAFVGVYHVFNNYKSITSSSNPQDEVNTILLNKKEIVLKEDGDIFILIASVPDTNSSEVFTFTSSNEEAIELTSDGPNKVIIKRLKLFSDTITISVSTMDMNKKAICNVRCYNEINELGKIIINEVKDASSKTFDAFKESESLILKENLTYDLSIEINTLFSSLLGEGNSSYALEAEDLEVFESAIKSFFNDNQIINIREDKTSENTLCVRFLLLYSSDIFLGQKNITKSMQVNKVIKDYTILSYEPASSLNLPNSSEFVI